jgi:hypothetical protein
MSDSTRRGFLAVAGVGAVAGVAVAVAPGAGAVVGGDVSLPSGAAGSMAAYIHDLRLGEVALMIEGREVVVTDRALVARLAQAFAKAQRGRGLSSMSNV